MSEAERKTTLPDMAIELADAVSSLTSVLAMETELLKAGRVRDALRLETQKSNTAESYVRLMRIANENVETLGGQESDAYKQLQTKLADLTLAVEENVAALVSAKSVSEDLIETAASYVNNKTGGASTYTANGNMQVSHAKGTKSVALSKEI